MPDPKYLQPREGLTSLQAAALYLSDGKTDNVEEANHIAAGGNGLNMDALQKANLRRMMGFDFDVKLKHKKISVFSTEAPYVIHTVKYSGLMNEKTVDKIVDACATLKELYETQKEEDAELLPSEMFPGFSEHTCNSHCDVSKDLHKYVKGEYINE